MSRVQATIDTLLEQRSVGHAPVLRLMSDDEIINRVRAVLELHRQCIGHPWQNPWCDECIDADGINVDWPCNTIKCLEGTY